MNKYLENILDVIENNKENITDYQYMMFMNIFKQINDGVNINNLNQSIINSYHSIEMPFEVIPLNNHIIEDESNIKRIFKSILCNTLPIFLIVWIVYGFIYYN